MTKSQYYDYLGKQIDDLRGEISLLRSNADDDLADARQAELRDLMEERSVLSRSLTGAPTAGKTPINPVTGAPAGPARYRDTNPYR